MAEAVELGGWAAHLLASVGLSVICPVSSPIKQKYYNSETVTVITLVEWLLLELQKIYCLSYL